LTPAVIALQFFLSLDCVLFATLRNFCQTVMVPASFSYWLSQSDYNKGGFMKSRIVKRSIVIRGHKTSVSLEDEFWNALKVIAGERLAHLSDLVAAIDGQRQHSNLSSAIRLFVFDFYRSRVSADETVIGFREIMQASRPGVAL
jgi:predicted DNA-binding ribbon-helix-helix protein